MGVSPGWLFFFKKSFSYSLRFADISKSLEAAALIESLIKRILN